jgi:peptidoglycan/xylan/chitin deacetylase (PgdA/CDA1 family)
MGKFSLLGLALVSLLACARDVLPETQPPGWIYDQGGVVRAETGERRLALIFTGGDYGEGTEHILDVLARQGISASFFVTGAYIHQAPLRPLLQRMVDEGHYLGPHSDEHLLYAPWDDRSVSLVTRAQFQADLERNIADLRAFGALRGEGPHWFIPPYEWYNEQHVAWAREMNLLLFNFTPGIGSHRDWAPEGHAVFRPSEQILEDILTFEESDPHGLSGALLLLHLGSQREDKMHRLLEPLIAELKGRGYDFVRVDEMLAVE